MHFFTRLHLDSLKRTSMFLLGVLFALILLPAFSDAQTYSSTTTDGNPAVDPGMPGDFTVTLVDGPVYNPTANVTLFRWRIQNNQKYGLSHAALSVCNNEETTLGNSTYSWIKSNLGTIKAFIAPNKSKTVNENTTIDSYANSGSISFGYDPSCGVVLGTNGNPKYSLKVEGNYFNDSYLTIQLPGKFSGSVVNNAGTYPNDYSLMYLKYATYCLASNIVAKTGTIIAGIGCYEECKLAVSSVNVTSTTCYGTNTGAIDLEISDAIYGANYVWSNGNTNQDQSNISAGSYSVTITDGKGCIAVTTATVTAAPQILTTVNRTNISCNGNTDGSLSLTVSGGSGSGYTYSWSTAETSSAITGLSVGTYSVTVTDGNGCTATAMSTISQPAVLTATTTATDVNCYQGSTGAVNLTVSGGNGGYTYLWSNSSTTEDVSALTAGTYSVTVSDSRGCTATASNTVNQPASSVGVTTESVDATCPGGSNGSVSLTVSGGTAPYSYTWSNNSTTSSITGLSAATYSATVTDNKGCKAYASATVGQPNDPILITATPTDVSCNGGNDGRIVLTVSGGSGSISYNWSNGKTTSTITGLSASAYTVTASDTRGCTALVTSTVNQPTALGVTATNSDVSCYGGSNGSVTLALSGGCPAYTYAWSNGATTQNITGLTAAVYTVTVTDTRNCTARISSTVNQPSSTVGVTATPSNVKCFGNATGSIALSVSGGTPGYLYNWSNGATVATATGLSAASYSVTVTDTRGCKANASATVGQPASALSITASATDATCNGGSNGTLTIRASGGTSSYSYAWSSGANTTNVTGVSAGVYNVTVTDANSCMAYASVTVGQPANPVAITATPTDVSCYGGSNGRVNLNVTGGCSSDYTYTWSNGKTTQNITGLTVGTYSVTVSDTRGCNGKASATVGQPAQLLVTATKTDVSCNGGNSGSVTLTLSGGCPNYAYNWSNGATSQNITGLTAAVYSVTVTDTRGCTAKASATVGQPALPLSVTTSKTDVSCYGGNNGTVSLNVACGTGGYTYSWSNGLTVQNLTAVSAGTYNVTVSDANGCKVNGSATVGQPASALTITASATDVVCSGGSGGTLSVVASGGTSPYSYVWTGGATVTSASGVAAGIYGVTVTDAKSCKANATVTVGQPASPVMVTATPTDVSCYGGSNGRVNLNVTGGCSSDYTYAWSNGRTTQNITGLSAGTYSVTVSDTRGCNAKASATVGQPAQLLVTATKTDVSCNGGNNGSVTLSLSGGCPNYLYTWSNGSTSQNITGLTADVYSVTVTDTRGCTVNASATVGQPALPLSVTTSKTDVSCYGGNNGTVSLNVACGTAGYKYSWSNGLTVQNLTAVTAGTYNVTVTDANGCKVSGSATVGQPASALSITASSTDITCNGGSGGSISVVASGGTSPYSYVWTGGATVTGATGVPAGTYGVTVTDANGCKANASVTVGQPANAVSITATAGDVSCNGGNNGSVSLVVSGGSGAYTYSWSNGRTTQNITGLTAGMYSVTVSDSRGCNAKASATVGQPAQLVISATPTDVSCNGDMDGSIMLNVTGGTGSVTYAWSGVGTYSSTNMNISSLSAGTYTVTVKDANNCTATAQAIVKKLECPKIFCTYSQGYFGNYGGNASYFDNNGNCNPSKNSTLKTVQDAIKAWGSDSRYFVGNVDMSKVSADQIITYLPGGGSVNTYDGTQFPAASNDLKSTFFAQTLALAMNIGINGGPDKGLGAWVIPSKFYVAPTGSCSGTALDQGSLFTMPESVVGKTVTQVFVDAGKSLASASDKNKELYKSLVSKLNELFESCAVVTNAESSLTNTGVGGLTSSSNSSTPVISVTAYPNPFIDKVNLKFVSSLSGDATVEIFDMAGRRLTLIVKPNVLAGRDQLVEYIVPQIGNRAIIYKVSISGIQVVGRLIAPTR